MQKIVRNGIPSPQECLSLPKDAAFKILENYSTAFLTKYETLLRPYAKKWVIDPLNQWSRQWEYSFMHAAVSKVMDIDQPVHILDAGCGLTFFPYFLLEQFPALTISACDIDRSLEDLYASISTQQDRTPSFSVADLTALPYPDQSFDAIYCVSVLEHIPARERVMKEFARVLKPEGKLIVSFDISLDGSRDICLPEAARMLVELSRYFQGTECLEIPSLESCKIENYFTTHDARVGQLPWTYPAMLYQMRALLQGKGWPTWPPLLTVSCGVLQKKA